MLNKKIVWVSLGLILVLFLLFRFVLIQRDSFGIYDLKYNRLENIVYIKNSLQPNSEWKKTNLKNLRHAKVYIEKREREKALWKLEDEIKSAIEDRMRRTNE